MAVGVGASEIQPYLATAGGRVVIACHNSPESLTLSGDADAIAQLKGTLDTEKKFARLLSTGGNAYHSRHMKSVGQQYEDEMAEQAYRVSLKGSKNPKNLDSLPIAFFPSVYGRANPADVHGPRYWRKNLESPVLFHQAVTELVKMVPVDIFIEIGPHSALQGPLRQISRINTSKTRFPEYLAAMVRNNNNVTDVLSLAGDLFTKGYPVDLGRVNAIDTEEPNHVQSGRVVTDLPHYQWRYPDEVLLHENRYTREWRLRTHPRHDILGSRIPGGVKAEPTWRNVLRNKDIAWLTDHRVSYIA